MTRSLALGQTFEEPDFVPSDPTCFDRVDRPDDSDTFEVVFPDDDSYVGTLTSPTTMQRNGGPSAASYAVLT